MKSKRLLLALILCLLTVGCVLALSACGEVAFEVHFMVDGERYATVTTAGEETISMPENPTKEGYTFEGWYWDEGTWQKPFTVNSLLDAPLSDNMQVYAHFIEDGADDGGSNEGGNTEGGSTEGGNTEGGNTEGGNTEGGNTEGGSNEGGNTGSGNTEGSTTAHLLAYEINGDGVTCTVTGMGDCTDTKLVIPTTIDGYTVTSIGEEAFLRCTGLTSITIPESVTSIGSSAFSGCTSLASITIPSSVTSIGDSAFYSCMGLTSITIPASVTSIDSFAFAGCYKLVEVYDLSEHLTITADSDDDGSLGYYAKVVHTSVAEESRVHTTQDGYIFYENGDEVYLLGYIGADTPLTLPDKYNGKTYEIYQSAFYNCTSLTSITIPNSVTSIGDEAFTGCRGLTSITIPASVTNIGSSAFYRCTSLASVTFEGDSQLTSIGSSAFYECTGLTSITIPSSVTSIGDEAFAACYKLVEVYDLSEHLTITAGSDDNGYVGAYAKVVHTSVAEESCLHTTQDGYVFFENGNEVYLVGYVGTDIALTLPDQYNGKTYGVYQYAFYKCKDLTRITIPEGVTSIGKGAFSGCSSLVEMTIPFVGGTAGKTSSSTYQYPFGYIFGTDSYTGGRAVQQYYYGSYTSSTTTSTYYIPANLRRVTVTGGNILYGAFYNCSMLTKVTLPNSVTSIGGSAFSGCTGLKSITIPSSVTSIGYYAFYGCTSLAYTTYGNAKYLGNSDNPYLVLIKATSTSITSCTIHENTKVIAGGAFRGCTGLTSVTFAGDSQLTSIGDYAFYGCYGLTSIKIPSSVTSIGDYAFYGCTGLTSVTFEGDSQLTSIDDWAFSGCTGLKSIKIPEGVTSIGSSAFASCTGLTNITVAQGNTKYHSSGNCLIETATKTLILGCQNSVIPTDGSVTSIGSYAFRDCTGLTSITIPSSVASIGASAFSGCSSLVEMTIPFVGGTAGKTSSDTYQYPFGYIFGTSSYTGGTKVTQSYYGSSTSNITGSTYYIPATLRRVTVTGGNLLYRAFDNCSMLTEVTLLSSVTSIGNYAFEDCKGLTSITIPSSVTSIGSYAFSYCRNLTSITIPSSVTSISGAAFYGCTSLASITIPSSVTSIGKYAFYCCMGLTSITIPEGVTSIGEDAFYGCTSLTSITIPESVTSIGWSAFDFCFKLVEVYDLSEHLTITAGSSGNGYVGYYAKVVHTSVAEESCLHTTQDGYVFFENGDEVYLVGYVGTDTALTLPDKYNGKAYGINQYAFQYCTSLTSITIPSSVTSIGSYAFEDCTGLTSITIPEGVTSIGKYAFRGCTSLASVTFADDSQLTSIGSWAFEDCTGLTNVYVSTTGWYRYTSSIATSGTSVDLSDSATAATYLKSTYVSYYFKRNG